MRRTIIKSSRRTQESQFFISPSNFVFSSLLSFLLSFSSFLLNIFDTPELFASNSHLSTSNKSLNMLAQNILFACTAVFAAFATASPIQKRAVTVVTDNGSKSLTSALKAPAQLDSFESGTSKADAASTVLGVVNQAVQLVQGLIDKDIAVSFKNSKSSYQKLTPFLSASSKIHTRNCLSSRCCISYWNNRHVQRWIRSCRHSNRQARDQLQSQGWLQRELRCSCNRSRSKFHTQG